MANENAKHDENHIPTLLAVTDDVNKEIRRLLVDPTTGRLKIAASIPASTDLIVNSVTATDHISVGNQGTEGTGININGVVFDSTFKVSDIDGSNFAQTILHRHSTVLEPLIVGARSNTNDNTHSDVTAGQNVFTIYGAGWAGSNYKLFGSINIGADSTGSISNTSAPGRVLISVTPDGSISPVNALSIINSGLVGINTTSPLYQLDTRGTLGAELITDGGFDTGAGWTPGTGWVISGGLATYTGPNPNTSLTQNINVVSGNYYSVTFTVTAINGGSMFVRLGSQSQVYFSTAGTYTKVIKANASGSIQLIFGISGSAVLSYSLDNVSVKQLTNGDIFSQRDVNVGGRLKLIYGGSGEGMGSIVFCRSFADTTDQATIFYNDNNGMVISSSLSIGGTTSCNTYNPNSGVLTINTIGSASANANLTTISSGTLSQTSGTNSALRINPTYNQTSGTASNTDLLINRTATALGTGIQSLLDMQVGGTSWYSFGTGNTATTGGLNASSGIEYGLKILPVINQSGTAGYSALFINPTETAVGSGVRNMIHVKVGANDRFTVANGGNTVINSAAASGIGLQVVLAGLQTGQALQIASASTTLSSGILLDVQKTGATGGAAYTGSIANINYTQTFNGGVGLNSTGNTLNVNRNITLNNAGNTHTISGSLVNITDSGTQTAGTLTNTSNVVSITQNYASASGTVLLLNSAGSGLLADLQAGGVSRFNVDNLGNVILGGQSAKSITEARNTTPNTAGNILNIQSGGATVGATDKDAGMLVLSPGISTGTGKSSISIQRLSRAASTGTADNALSDAFIVPSANSKTSETTHNLFEIALPAGTATGGQISYTITATDGTEYQSHSGIAWYAAVNKGGVYTMQITDGPATTQADANSSGSITDTFSMASGTDKVTISIAVSCSTITANNVKIFYTILNSSDQAITQL